MKLQTQKLTALGLLLVVLAGCQSGRFTHCTSPQISGRVLAADTRQPLAGATVARVKPQPFEPFGPPKGGQLLKGTIVVRTDADGRFVLNGETVVAVFRKPGWWSVPVIFDCSGYQSFETTYTGANIESRSADGMTLVNVGDVLLQPVAGKTPPANKPSAGQ